MDIPNSTRERNWHRIFEFGIILKTLNGFLELISGLLVLLVSQNSFLNIFLKLTRAELVEDPNDRFITYIAHNLQQISADTKFFAAIYILLHGIINLFVAYQLYKEKLWAYKVAIIIIVAFMGYQVYRISYTHSIILGVITLWDAVFIGVIWHEYKIYRNKP